MNKRLITILIVATLLVASALFYLYSTTTSPTPDTTTKTCTTYGGSVEEQCIEDYIGLTEDEAIARAKAHGYGPVIASVNGVSRPTENYAGDIIYFDIREGVIINAYFSDDRIKLQNAESDS